MVNKMIRTNMKDLRTSKGYTQDYVANAVGIKRSTYTLIELGKANPSFKVALKLKDFYGYNDDDIFLISNVENLNNRKEKGA